MRERVGDELTDLPRIRSPEIAVGHEAAPVREGHETQRPVPGDGEGARRLGIRAKGLAIEYPSRGIRVNAVAPGLIKTPMNPEAYHETLAGMHPLGRMGEVDDIVDAILFLDSATFVTGEILHVDGGQNAGH
jgi:hypothetical protein